jgi:DNA-binding CsgD family transcriptional regulator
VEIQVRTPLIFRDNREALTEFLRGLGYEPSTESPTEEPGFSLEDASDPRLTPREKEVLRLMAEGHTYWEITEMLHVGSGVVGAHAENIMKKLQHGRPELAHRYSSEPGGAFVLWLADTVRAAAAEELAQAVAGWMPEHLRLISCGGTVRVIFGADDKPLAEVPIEEDDANE